MDNLTPITREEMLMNDEPMTPITREEKILAGEDLNPVTRREYFLKKYRHAGGDVMVEGLSVTENGTYTAPEGKAYSPVEVAVPLPENAYLLKTASGSLVSFSDGADLPIPSFVCNIEAVQDLHGYDAPWVGGAGKNKLPNELKTGNHYGISFTKQSNGTYILSGTSNLSSSFDVYFESENGSASTTLLLPSGTYKLSGISGGSQSTYRLYVAIYGSTTRFVGLNDGETTFTLTEDTYVGVFIRIYSETTINNLTVYPMIRLATETDPTFAPYSNICPISGHTGVDAVISPTTEASAGTTYSVSWQTEAGEVFGGYVDLVSGVLTVDKAGVDMGTLTWIKDSSANNSRYVAQRSGIKSNSTIISDIFKPATYSEVYYHRVDEAIATHDTYAQIVIHSSTFEAEYDADGFKTQMSGHYAVYELATPQTYQLTPHQIKSLLGNNNAWCDTGKVDIDYFAKEVTG